MSEAECFRIVIQLAHEDPIAAQEITGDRYCTLCDWAEPMPAHGELGDPLPSDHNENCPWRRAVEMNQGQ